MNWKTLSTKLQKLRAFQNIPYKGQTTRVPHSIINSSFSTAEAMREIIPVSKKRRKANHTQPYVLRDMNNLRNFIQKGKFELKIKI